MDAEPESKAQQAAADATENDVEQRHARWQGLMEVIADAAGRADAMFRLELALDLRRV